MSGFRTVRTICRQLQALVVMHPYPFYYSIKPWLPWRLRHAVKTIRARWLLKSCGDVWPIKETAALKPEGWPGWPDGKKFAFVLTHDVESQAGLDRIRQLAELEMSLGFRSSFNFVPEGSYRVPAELRNWLTSNGFEVGVHGLHHDGKLYTSTDVFQERARSINRYLQEWRSVGFRSPFMHHNLDWLHQLNIAYDSSTFDTDPFEPQPDDVDTIFPFWVPSTSREEPGYVELPYTMPQDITLFLLMGHRTAKIWEAKLDWLAGHGGMVFFDAHPDYMAVDSKQSTTSLYDMRLYSQFLEHVGTKYSGMYWHALAKDVASWYRAATGRPSFQAGMLTRSGKQIAPPAKIWIDLDNTPHVPFFQPIIAELSRRGHKVFVTARDAFQVCDLADKKGLRYTKVGRHHGKNPMRKFLGLFYRACQLSGVVLKEKPDLAVSHGSRSQMILCKVLGITSVVIGDYEYSKTIPLFGPKWEIVPEVIKAQNLAARRDRIRTYPGIKEDVYAWMFEPDPSILKELGLDNGNVVVTVRPPATEAHYHNPESEVLFARFMDRMTKLPEVKAVLLPRNQKQADYFYKCWPEWFAGDKTVIPSRVLDGLNLLWHSDLVVSGGGTMNREAAALGIPVYSIFKGKIGAVDRELNRQGRLELIENAEQVDTKIIFQHRRIATRSSGSGSDALSKVLDHIDAIAKSSCATRFRRSDMKT